MRRVVRMAGSGLVLAGLLGGVSACGSPFGGEHAVFGKPLGKQLQAASRASQEGLTARFTSRLDYGGTGTKATDVVAGTLDWDQDVARAERTVHVPEPLAESDASAIGGREGRRDVRQTYAVRGHGSVYVAADGAKGRTWVRFTPAEREKRGLNGDSDLNRLNGAVLPYGGTLAEVLPHAKPGKEPAHLPGGGRRYTATVSAAHAADVLPAALARPLRQAEHLGHAKGFTVTVTTDGKGRVVRMTADLAAQLDELHTRGLLSDVTTLRSELRLSRYGRWQREDFPGAHRLVTSTETVRTARGLRPGQCADTQLLGLGSRALFPVDCADPHDLWKFPSGTYERTLGTLDGLDALPLAACRAGLADAEPVNGAPDPKALTVTRDGLRYAVVRKNGTDKNPDWRGTPPTKLPKNTELRVGGDASCLVTTAYEPLS
ncbi:hypothetical protein [Streptomyces sp. AM 3-1-1]|uniref:hypothetical protein n=1 Tax=Streptomyces sp. AM 3-1-1 TaxID=3028711 RepID=UPI0023B8EB53|nr:hypothetical protein [Streptomyces sp. AM 3-1-1]WEH29903.1 hypothetical protein P0D76_22705 [Streptomyces sp. AM 3-1-1]